MSDIQTGLLLLVIGFPTVFLILWLVILLGKGLISAVNKYAPEEAPVRVTAGTAISESEHERVSPTKLSVIVSAVNLITGGKGKVTKIEKM